MKKEMPKHGFCECAGPTCCGGYGPVAYELMRDGKLMRVCTRCDFSTDTDKRLLVTLDEPTEPYMKFDALGGMCILVSLAEKTEASK